LTSVIQLLISRIPRTILTVDQHAFAGLTTDGRPYVDGYLSAVKDVYGLARTLTIHLWSRNLLNNFHWHGD